MSSSFASLLRPLTLGLAFAASGAALHAQSLTGALSNDTTGPVTPGVHEVIGAISVQPGKTLTVQAGAILKFHAGGSFGLQGVLNVVGTLANPVIFTSFDDDTAGGDSNGNGNATSPSAGQWTGTIFSPGSEGSVLDHADIRYGGSGGWANIYLNGVTALTVKNSVSRHGATAGLQAAGSAGSFSITGDTFTGNAGVAIDGVRLDTVAGFLNNGGSGNGGNYLRVTVPAATVPVTIGAANCMNGALVLNTNPNVGVPLTLNAGTVIKVQGGQSIFLSAKLTVNGTAANPVVITSFDDDSIAGDTNNNLNGTAPSAGQWTGLLFSAGSEASVIDHADIRYGGSGGWANVYFNAAGLGLTLKNSVVRNGATAGINCAGQSTAAGTSITGNTFTGNAGVAIDNVRLDTVPGFTANAASGNGGNYLRVTSPTIAAPTAIGPSSCINGALVLATNPTLGAPLTLGAGTVIKVQGGQSVVVQSALTVNGTVAAPVVITSFDDDSVAGDTNNDLNATAPSPGQWAGLIFSAGSAGSVIDHADIRYAGAGGWAGVYLNAPVNITLKNSVLRHSAAAGFNAALQVAAPLVSNCVFTGNVGDAIGNLRLASAPGFANNTASGNGANFMRIVDAGISGSTTIDKQNCLNGSLVVVSNFNVAAGGALHLLPGVHVKIAGPLIVVDGAIDAQGTSTAPVIFTSFHDDSIDGDTNNNLNGSSPSKGDWPGFLINAGAASSTLTHVRVRYAGAGGWSGITSASPALHLQVVRVEHSATHGFLLGSIATPGTDLVAWDCNAHGFELEGGTFQLLRCTAASNGGSGFQSNGGFAGTIRSSLAWGNGSNFGALPAGSVHFSDGSAALAGSNGNLNVDPQFVSVGSGDLTLQKTSPVIDKGDPAEVAFGVDDVGYPRFMDGNLDKQKVVDMGAYEFDHVHLAVTGNPTPGGTLTISTTGTAGLTTFLFIGVVQDEQFLKQFGPLFMNVVAPHVLTGWLPIPSAVPIVIPPSLPVPLPLIFQELGIQGTTGNDPGNLSDPVYITVN